MADDEADTRLYLVVLNDEEQYSIWLADRALPSGWRAEGTRGTKTECLDHIGKVWTDMRPLSVRRKLAEWEAEQARNPSPPVELEPWPEVDDLVSRLGEIQAARAVTRPRPDPALLQAAIERSYVHIRFERTGTELGVRLDRPRCTLDGAKLHFEGELVLNYNRVRLIADIDASDMAGTAKLVFLASVQPGAAFPAAAGETAGVGVGT